MSVDGVFRCSKSFPHEVGVFWLEKVSPPSYLVSIWFKADNVFVIEPILHYHEIPFVEFGPANETLLFVQLIAG